MAKIKKIIAKIGKKKTIALIVVIAAVVGWVIFVNKRQNGKLETATVSKGTVKEELVLSGEIKADEHAQLKFPASGEIAWVGVKEGDKVYKGQALISLDKTTLDAAYQQASSNLRKYEATVDYVHDQVKNHDTDETYAQRDTRTTAEANKDYYYDAFRVAEYNLQHATITAPFAGLVTLVANPFAGINVLLTETQIELVNPETMYFEVTADQNEIPDISLDQKVTLVLDSYPEEEIGGEVNFISITPLTGETGAVYKVRVNFNLQDIELEKLRVGMTGDARFTLSQKEDVLYLPSGFINSDKKGKYVLLNKKKKVYIEIGLEGEETTEIKNELKEGDVVYD